MKTKRIILHRRRGRTSINDREMFRQFSAWYSFILHPAELTQLEKRILTGMGLKLQMLEKEEADE